MSALKYIALGRAQRCLLTKRLITGLMAAIPQAKSSSKKILGGLDHIAESQKLKIDTLTSRPPSARQLEEWGRSREDISLLTTSWGAPIADKLNSKSVGPRGPLLLEDTHLIDEMAHFDRERIPERVVHAKGAGAFGYFEVTHDITKYCKADIFSQVGKKTPCAVRFSTVGGESGSADTVRDPRGFACKFYTNLGNWDLVGNNTPIFFIRDPVFFPSFIHTQKRNPVTHCKDPDAFWDFITLRQETAHQVVFLFSDRGTPVGHRHMNGYGSHTFKLVNKDDKAVYCKFHLKTQQGVKNFDRDQAAEAAKVDPDYALRDLYNNIAEGKFPSWKMYIQVMTMEQAEEAEQNPFDLTKVWSHKDFPLIEVGKMTLNKNPRNYFAEVEQAAFSPNNMVPGIEPSPDKMLQARLFSYDDTHRHRLGANFRQIPVNCPINSQAATYYRDGPMSMELNQEGAPNYFPNSFSGPSQDKTYAEHVTKISGEARRIDSSHDDNYSQVTAFYNDVLKEDEKIRLSDNIAHHSSKAHPYIQKRVVEMFSKVHEELGKEIEEKQELYRKMPNPTLKHL